MNRAYNCRECGKPVATENRIVFRKELSKGNGKRGNQIHVSCLCRWAKDGRFAEIVSQYATQNRAEPRISGEDRQLLDALHSMNAGDRTALLNLVKARTDG